MIKWKGFIPVIIVVVVLVLGKMFFLDWVVHKAVVSGIQSAAKAKVDLRDTHVSFIPFGVELESLKVANRNAPMTNAFEAEKISLKLSLYPLFKRKLIVDDVSIVGAAFNTARSQSGALWRYRKANEKAEHNTLVSRLKKEISSVNLKQYFDPPKINDALDVDSLEVKKQVESIQKSLKSTTKKLELTTNKTAVSNEIDTIKSEFSELENISDIKVKSVQDIAQLTAYFKKVQTIQKSVDSITSAINSQVKTIEAEYNNTIKQISNLSSLANQDYSNAVRLLKVDDIRSGNLVNIFIEKTIRNQIQQAVKKGNQGIDRLQKLKGKSPKTLSRLQGETIQFARPHTNPTLWVKKIAISGSDRHGQLIDGLVTDISSDQTATQKPMIINLNMKHVGFKGVGWDLSSVIDSRIAPQTIDFDLDVSTIPIPSMHLVKIGRKSLKLNSALGHVKVAFFQKAKQLNGEVVGTVSNIKTNGYQFNATGLSLESFVSAVATNAKRVDLKALVSGDVDDPTIKVRSNLDDIISKQLGLLLQIQAKRIKSQIRNRINTITAQEKEKLMELVVKNKSNLISEILTQKKELDIFESQIKAYEKKVNEKIKESRSDFESKHLEEIKQNLENQFKGLF